MHRTFSCANVLRLVHVFQCLEQRNNLLLSCPFLLLSVHSENHYQIKSLSKARTFHKVIKLRFLYRNQDLILAGHLNTKI